MVVGILKSKTAWIFVIDFELKFLFKIKFFVLKIAKYVWNGLAHKLMESMHIE